jgi:hypothetical protein
MKALFGMEHPLQRILLLTLASQRNAAGRKKPTKAAALLLMLETTTVCPAAPPQVRPNADRSKAKWNENKKQNWGYRRNASNRDG